MIEPLHAKDVEQPHVVTASVNGRCSSTIPVDFTTCRRQLNRSSTEVITARAGIPSKSIPLTVLSGQWKDAINC